MSLNGYSLNPEAQEFSISLKKNTSWNILAVDFIPIIGSSSAIKKEEIKEPPKPQKKLYSFSVLFSLRELCTALPQGVVIPELYSKCRSSKNKKKTPPISKDQAFKRPESIFVSSKVLKKAEKPFTEKLKKNTDELEKKQREIRCILNKLTHGNFDKLSKSLVTDFVYNDALLTNLANFLFERATALNFPEIYAQLCRRLRIDFKSIGLSTRFRTAVVEKCRESFYKEDEPLEGDKLMETEFKRRRRLIGNIKFIALLHKEQMIKSDIMYECFDVLLDEKLLSEETLETCITLFKDTCPLLVSINPERVAYYYDLLISFIDNLQFTKRIHFMIQDLIEMKSKIMTPRLQKKIKSPSKITQKVVEEIGENGLNDENKDIIKDLTRTYVNGGDSEYWIPNLKKLIQNNFKYHLEIIEQVLKYGLYEYYKEEFIEKACKLVMIIIKDYNLESNICCKAINLIESDMEEIKTDNPTADKMFSFMKSIFNIE